MHGPCSTTGLSGWQACPHFGHGLTHDGRVKIKLVDDVVETLGALKRPVWRLARSKAIGRWEAAGLKFLVTEDEGWVYADPSVNPDYIAKTIRLVRSGPGFPRKDFAQYNAEADAAVASYTPEPSWWKEYLNLSVLQFTIGHEIGHCLGLDHGGDGIMEGNWKPNAHDLDSIRRYYL